MCAAASGADWEGGCCRHRRRSGVWRASVSLGLARLSAPEPSSTGRTVGPGPADLGGQGGKNQGWRPGFWKAWPMGGATSPQNPPVTPACQLQRNADKHEGRDEGTRTRPPPKSAPGGRGEGLVWHPPALSHRQLGETRSDGDGVTWGMGSDGGDRVRGQMEMGSHGGRGQREEVEVDGERGRQR